MEINFPHDGEPTIGDSYLTVPLHSKRGYIMQRMLYRPSELVYRSNLEIALVALKRVRSISKQAAIVRIINAAMRRIEKPHV